MDTPCCKVILAIREPEDMWDSSPTAPAPQIGAAYQKLVMRRDPGNTVEHKLIERFLNLEHLSCH